jgi:Uma2 family endonuclease
MTVVPVTKDDRPGLPLPHDREWTVDDLETLPDDGLQYELFDRVLVVSPAPFKPHQRSLLGMAVLLRAACPPELEVFVAPLDFQPNRVRSFQPDVLVLRRDDGSDTKVFEPPVLAVEVLSKSTPAKVYRDAVQAVGEETVRVERPYPVELRPARIATG